MAIFDAAFYGLYAMVIFRRAFLIAMVNTLAIGVIERTREIGMLRAVATHGQVRQIVLAESLIPPRWARSSASWRIISGLHGRGGAEVRWFPDGLHLPPRAWS